MTFTEMFASCLVMITVAALYEGLKVLREWLLKRPVVPQHNGGPVPVPTSEDPTPATRFALKHSHSLVNAFSVSIISL
jgi:hypothetical protein